MNIYMKHIRKRLYESHRCPSQTCISTRFLLSTACDADDGRPDTDRQTDGQTRPRQTGRQTESYRKHVGNIYEIMGNI